MRRERRGGEQVDGWRWRKGGATLISDLNFPYTNDSRCICDLFGSTTVHDGALCPHAREPQSNRSSNVPTREMQV